MKTLLLMFVALCGTIRADSITVVFNFDITSEFLYSSQTYNPSFTPQNITVTTTFDDTPTSKASDPNNIETFFGVPVVSSPLTAMLPYGPATTTIDPSPGNTDTLMTDFDFGSGVPPDGSYFQIQENQENAYGPSSMQEWSYNFEIRFPASNAQPPLSNPTTFGGADLVTWLNGLESNQIPVLIEEESIDYNQVTAQYLGGIGYTGEGVITAINGTPEPATATLIGLGLAGLIILKPRHA